MSEPIAYLNGRMVPISQACLPVYDAGVVLGATVSDLMRTFHGRPFRLRQHLERLVSSMRLAGMAIDLNEDRLAEISEELIASNMRLVKEGGELGLVVFITAGDLSSFAEMMDRPLRLTPTVCIHTFPLRFSLYARAMSQGARLVTPSVRQVPPVCWDPRIKCRSRMHYYLAEQEVRTTDPDATALLLDLDGNVTETGTANFLMVHSGAIVSPPRGSVLPGISQAVTTELATNLGMMVIERSILSTDLVAAEEAFLASTPYCLAPVSQINESPVGNGRPGPIYMRLLEAWNQEVGLDIRRQICDAADRGV